MKKRKLLIIALLLFAVIGIAGYGAYSYYYTESTMSTETPNDANADNVIRITGEFNPWVSVPSLSEGFLGNGGSIALVCPEKTGINKQITCESTVEVQNNGSTPIRVSYSNFYTSASSDDISVSVANSHIGWNDSSNSYIVIEPSSHSNLYISAIVNVGNPGNNNIGNDEPELVTGPVESGSLTAYASFSLSATQLNNNE